jgi:hypothetical protein
MRFPYPLYPREYVYVRRYCVDLNENLLILVAKGLPDLEFEQLDPKQQPKNEASKNYVRVTNYKSNFIVIPHSDFDKPGMNYVIQYYDINKANIPKVAYSWMAASGLPDYIERLHSATMKLRETKIKMQNESETCETLLKDELSKYEVFHLYKENKNKSTTNLNNLKNDIKITSEIKNDQVDLSTEILINHKIENNETSKQMKSKSDIYLEKILEKLTSDYFSQSEPHEIFYNF